MGSGLYMLVVIGDDGDDDGDIGLGVVGLSFLDAMILLLTTSYVITYLCTLPA